MKTLVTHDGSFHADDIFSTAVLSLFLAKQGEAFEVIRTRDTEIIKKGDFVYDVGGIYDENLNRFDHHQKGGAGKRENGIEYASIGLVWKKFGVELCGSKEIAELIEKRLVSPIDANDNGMSLVEKKYEVFPYLIQDFFRVMRPTWREGDEKNNEMFFKCVEFAKIILEREIIHATDTILADKAISDIYNNTEDKRIIVFDQNYDGVEIFNKMPEVIFVVYPRNADNSWAVKAVRDDSMSFKNKRDLPSSWGGLNDEDLQKVTGVPDAVFCHRALFMAVAKTQEGAVKLAELALLE